MGRRFVATYKWRAVSSDPGLSGRLLVPGFQGPRKASKWLRQIQGVDEPYVTARTISMHSYLTPNWREGRWFL